MEKETIEQLLENNTILVETNNRLVDNNQQAINIIKEQLAENEDTMDYLKQEYQALQDKKNRSIQQEVQYHYLKKKLTGK